MKNKHFFNRITLALILTLVLSVILVPTLASAQSGSGSGRLTAYGSGLAGLRGNGTVTISGEGVLWIRDLNGNAEIKISGQGRRTNLPSGWTRYAGFNGQATVTGSQITVALSGADIEMQATGRGKFILRGEGSYTVRKNDITTTGSWTMEAKVMELK